MPHHATPGSFKPGHPYLGGGRTSLRTEIERKFGKNGSDAWDVLESIMHGRLESVQEHVLSDGRIVEYIRRPTIAERKDAAITVIQYLEGKPPQATLNVNVNADAAKLSEADLKARVAEIVMRYATTPPALPSERERTLIPESVDHAPERERGEE